ncbi:hypothetical protein B6S12_10625, partial [Helicobacter valdiviensis]
MDSNNQTYKVIVPNTAELEVNKLTNEVYFMESLSETGKYTKEYSKAVIEADRILRNSPYKDYKPIYLDPNFYTGERSTLL